MKSMSNYDKQPVITTGAREQDCIEGWPAVCAHLAQQTASLETCTIAIECYPGVFVKELLGALRLAFSSATFLCSDAAYKSCAELKTQFAGALTDDPVFGSMQQWEMADFFDRSLLQRLQAEVHDASGLTFVVGAGASLAAAHANFLVHAGVTRWEIQQRQRAHVVGNLGLENAADPPGRLYKNAFFVDWRVADRLRHEIYADVDFFLDMNCKDQPRMVAGNILREVVSQAVRRPFRVVPFFDPGPWGGDWMYRRFQLPEGPPNYAWCFDCVPEENGVVLGFGGRRFELPALVLVHEHPQELLGPSVLRRFGAEFPIRFDFLDTMNGGNLSLQVHPTAQYIHENFGMNYTQDESYYILDSEKDGCVYLGLRAGVDPARMGEALQEAQKGEVRFDAETFVNIWPARKHDHFLIPAGTVHCSGKNSVVLEISATPYIFTFKLWDWGRMGLDGKPRPIHLKHGLKNIQWNRTTEWVRSELIGQVQPLQQGEGWREERTGLHKAEFLETRRHWFVGPVPHATDGNLNVLNLVEGERAVVESPSGAFAPFEVNYAETFIVPAEVGEYSIRPVQMVDRPMATIKAFVRPDSPPANE